MASHVCSTAVFLLAATLLLGDAIAAPVIPQVPQQPSGWDAVIQEAQAALGTGQTAAQPIVPNPLSAFQSPFGAPQQPTAGFQPGTAPAPNTDPEAGRLQGLAQAAQTAAGSVAQPVAGVAQPVVTGFDAFGNPIVSAAPPVASGPVGSPLNAPGVLTPAATVPGQVPGQPQFGANPFQPQPVQQFDQFGRPIFVQAAPAQGLGVDAGTPGQLNPNLSFGF